MSRQMVDFLLGTGRLIADGVPYPDQMEAGARIDHWSKWFGFWAEVGARYERLGEEALSARFHVSAGELLWQASLSFHYAQLLWFDAPEEKEWGQGRKVEVYRRAARYLVPAAERVDLPYRRTTIPGYLRLPTNQATPFRCVILLGGLDSTKEESYLFENMCLRRGLATFVFDGPGQGEMRGRTALIHEFEAYTSAVLDYLASRPEIDGNRVAILGRSLGGYYAMRSAATDDRLRACVAWGPLFDMSDWDNLPLSIQKGFAYALGVKNLSKARRLTSDAIHLADVVEDLRCPLYVLHGSRDVIVSDDQIRKITKNVKAHIDLQIEKEGNHCCHNIYQLVRPRMADWLAGCLQTQS